MPDFMSQKQGESSPGTGGLSWADPRMLITDRIPPNTFSTDLRWPEGHLAGEVPGSILEPKKILLQLNRFRESTEEMTREAAGSNQSPYLLWGNQTLDLNQTMASRSHERAFPEPSLDLLSFRSWASRNFRP